LTLNVALSAIIAPSVNLQPCRWQKPAGVASFSDLYHNSVPDWRRKKRRLLPEKAPVFLDRKLAVVVGCGGG
jgi:protein gp37